MALAPGTVQCIPARFSRVPIITLHPASTTPVEVHSPGTILFQARLRVFESSRIDVIEFLQLVPQVALDLRLLLDV